MIYTFYDGNLIECQPIITVVTIDNEYVISEIEIQHNGKTFSVDKNQKFYASKIDYEQGKRKIIDLDYINIISSNQIHCSFDKTYYYYDNGEVKSYIPKDNITRFKGKVNFHSTIIVEKSDVIDGFIPDEIFLSRDDVFAYHDYKVIKDNGTEETRKGYFHKLLPNKKQQEIIDRLKAVLKEVDENNMIVFVDNEDNPIRVVNRPDMELHQWYDCDVEGYNKELFVPESQKIESKSLFVYSACCWGVNVNALNKEE